MFFIHSTCIAIGVVLYDIVVFVVNINVVVVNMDVVVVVEGVAVILYDPKDIYVSHSDTI